jgi:hypothetical protein
MTQCIIIPGRSLLWVTYLILASSLVFAQFGLVHFEDEWNVCHGAMSCFWLIVYKATVSRRLFGFANASNAGVDGGNAYMLGMLFDLTWFVWMFILLRIVGGLIFSTFVMLNTNGNERANILKNTSFVSGLERAKYADLGLKSPSFDELVATTQNRWNYVKLMLYLVKRNTVDLNGCESHVKACLDNDSLAWVPAKTSLAIQKSGKKYGVPSGRGGGGGTGGGATVLIGGGAKNVQATLALYHRECLGLRKEVVEVASMLSRMEEATIAANAAKAKKNKNNNKK